MATIHSRIIPRRAAMTEFGLTTSLLKVFETILKNRFKSINTLINSFLGKTIFVAYDSVSATMEFQIRW